MIKLDGSLLGSLILTCPLKLVTKMNILEIVTSQINPKLCQSKKAKKALCTEPDKKVNNAIKKLR